YDHIHIFRYDLCYQRRDLSWVTFRCSGHNLDLHGSSVTRNPQAAQDSLYTNSCRRFGARIDKTDSWDFRLLPVRGKRPRDSRSAEERHELAALHSRNHSITSSARASRVDGMVRPRALAVVRLMARSNLVGCSTDSALGGKRRRKAQIPMATRR